MDDSEICNEDLCDYLEQGLRKIKDSVYVLEKVLAKSQELNLDLLERSPEDMNVNLLLLTTYNYVKTALSSWSSVNS